MKFINVLLEQFKNKIQASLKTGRNCCNIVWIVKLLLKECSTANRIRIYIPYWRGDTPPHLACGLAPKTWVVFTPYHPGISRSPPQTRIQATQHLFPQWYTKKHTFIDFHCIPLFIVRLRKLQYFLGDYPHGDFQAQVRKCNFSKKIVVLPAKTVVTEILYVSVGNKSFTRARPRNFCTQK